MDSIMGPRIPKSEIIESGYLESMLGNFAASYKLYWFKGIYKEILLGNLDIEYKKLLPG